MTFPQNKAGFFYANHLAKGMLKKNVFIVLFLGLFFLTAACSETESKTESKTEISPVATGEDSPVEMTDNTEREHEKTIEREQENTTTLEQENTANNFVLPVEGVRPCAVMIDNEGYGCLPQGGLDQAQIIYEIIVEGGETRLMPLFWGVNPQMVGPVRSSRHYFLDYVMEHDAIYIHFGWSPMAMEEIPEFKINNINGVSNGGEIFRDLTNDRGNWQDSYTSMESINNYIKKVRYRTNAKNKMVFNYNKTDFELSEGQKAEKIAIRYSGTYTCGYVYDALKKDYLRFRKGEPQLERVNGLQLRAKNVFIQYVGNSTIKNDDKGRQLLADVGSGKGWFITCGKAVKIKWSKTSRSSPTKYTDRSGSEISLNPGRTWIQIVPLNGKVSIK